jgi:hypothetical protein
MVYNQNVVPPPRGTVRSAFLPERFHVKRWDIEVLWVTEFVGHPGYLVKMSSPTERCSVSYSTHEFVRAMQFMIDFLEEQNACS